MPIKIHKVFLYQITNLIARVLAPNTQPQSNEIVTGSVVEPTPKPSKKRPFRTFQELASRKKFLSSLNDQYYEDWETNTPIPSLDIYKIGEQELQGSGDYKKKKTFNWKKPTKDFAKGIGRVALDLVDKYDPGNQVGSTIGGLIGGFVPLPGASVIGAGIGKGLQGVIKTIGSQIIGSGDYTVKTNSILGSDPPSLTATGKKNNTVVFQHREYLNDIITSATPNTFLIRGIPINPCVQGMFPWLNSIANQYQMWRPRGLVFEFCSRSADALNSTNTALGTVTFCTDYNTNSKPPSTKQQMENTQYSSSCKPSENMMHGIECDPSMLVLPRLYTQKPVDLTRPVTANDYRFQELGRFYYATSGFQGSAVNIGELWLTYDIELSFPIENSNTALLGSHWNFTSDIANVSSTKPFGVILANPVDSNIDIKITSNSIIFPAGTNADYIVIYELKGDSTAITCPSISALNGATALNVGLSDTTNLLNAFTYTSTIMTMVTIWQVVDQGNGTLPTLTFSTGTFPTNLTNAELYINTWQTIV